MGSEQGSVGGTLLVATLSVTQAGTDYKQGPDWLQMPTARKSPAEYVGILS